MKAIRISKIYGVMLTKKVRRTGCALSRPVLLNQHAVAQVRLRYRSPQPSGWPGWGLGQAEQPPSPCHSWHSLLCERDAKQVLLFSMPAMICIGNTALIASSLYAQ